MNALQPDGKKKKVSISCALCYALFIRSLLVDDFQCAKENHYDQNVRNCVKRTVECVQYDGTLFWFWSGTETYDFDNHNRIKRSKHKCAYTNTHTGTVFSLDFFVLLLSTSRACIRYSSTGSSSLANLRSSLGANILYMC